MKRNERIILSVALSALTSLTVCGIAPLRLLVDNLTVFWFPVAELFVPMALLFGVVFTTLFVLSYLISAYFRNVYSVLLGFGAALYIQSEWLYYGYSAVNSVKIVSDSFGILAVANTLMWVLLLAGAVYLCLKKQKLFFRLALSASAVLIAIQLMTVSALVCKLDSEDVSLQNPQYLSVSGINEVSSKENVVVFVFDTFDDTYLKEIIDKDPDYLKSFNGFTYFSNNTGMYPTASGAVPYLLSGQTYGNEGTYSDYIADAYARTNYYHDLQRAGYDISIYGDLQYLNSDAILDKLSNLAQVTHVETSSQINLLINIYQAAAFRYLPHIAKGIAWYSVDDFTAWKISHVKVGYEPYQPDTLSLYKKIGNGQLRLKDTDEGCYKVFFCDGPQVSNEVEETQTEGAKPTYLDEAKGCLNVVSDYLSQLKELNVYNQTTILIVSTNGNKDQMFSSPIFLAKPRKAENELEISNAPVSQQDLLATVMSDIGLNKNGEYGMSAFDYEDGQWRERIFLQYSTTTKKDSALPTITEYKISPVNNKPESFSSQDYKPKQYKLGTKLNFSSEDYSAFDYCMTGFQSFTAKSTWASKKTITMAFKIEEPVQKDMLFSLEVVDVFNPPQRLIVAMEGKEVFQQEVETSGLIEFVIPEELIVDGRIELTCYMPDATPSEEGSARELSLNLASMSITPYRGINQAVLDQIPDYHFGQTLHFTEECPSAKPYCISGIGGFESGGTWTSADRVQLGFRITDKIQDDLLVIMKLNAVFNGSQEVRIAVEGQELYHKMLNTVETISFVIPKDLLFYEEIILEISLPDAVSPKSLGQSADEREIALDVVSLEIWEMSDTK